MCFLCWFYSCFWLLDLYVRKCKCKYSTENIILFYSSFFSRVYFLLLLRLPSHPSLQRWCTKICVTSLTPPLSKRRTLAASTISCCLKSGWKNPPVKIKFLGQLHATCIKKELWMIVPPRRMITPCCCSELSLSMLVAGAIVMVNVSRYICLAPPTPHIFLYSDLEEPCRNQGCAHSEALLQHLKYKLPTLTAEGIIKNLYLASGKKWAEQLFHTVKTTYLNECKLIMEYIVALQ